MGTLKTYLPSAWKKTSKKASTNLDDGESSKSSSGCGVNDNSTTGEPSGSGASGNPGTEEAPGSGDNTNPGTGEALGDGGNGNPTIGGASGNGNNGNPTIRDPPRQMPVALIPASPSPMPIIRQPASPASSATPATPASEVSLAAPGSSLYPVGDFRNSPRDHVLDTQATIMVSWLRQQQLEKLWSGGLPGEGVILKKGRGNFTCCPESLKDEAPQFYNQMASLNVQVCPNLLRFRGL